MLIRFLSFSLVSGPVRAPPSTPLITLLLSNIQNATNLPIMGAKPSIQHSEHPPTHFTILVRARPNGSTLCYDWFQITGGSRLWMLFRRIYAYRIVLRVGQITIFRLAHRPPFYATHISFTTPIHRTPTFVTSHE